MPSTDGYRRAMDLALMTEPGFDGAESLVTQGRAQLQAAVG